MVPSNLKVLAKFGLCSNCSQNLHECSLAHAYKIFASARMLGFWLKFPMCSVSIICILKTKTDTGSNVSRVGNWKPLGKHACAMNVSGKMILVLLMFIETDRPEFSPR